MIIAVVLAHEYPLVTGRLKFILQAASHARENDIFIIVNEYFKDHFDELVAGTTDRFYKGLEMERLSEEELRNIDFCFLPDNLLHLDTWKGSRTSYLLHAFNEADDEAVDYMVTQVDKALIKRGKTKPEFIINNMQTTANIRMLARHYECPLIVYGISAIRMADGYSQTLYIAHFNDNLYHVDSAKTLYDQYVSGGDTEKILSRREIIALIGKRRNMNLLPLLEQDGVFEIAYAGSGTCIIPQSYQYDFVTDDDIFYDIFQHYDLSKVTARMNPVRLKLNGLSMSHLKTDPTAFLLSARRVATVQSKIAVEAALWNRTVCVYGDALPYSFLMKNRIDQVNPLSERDLNYLLFCYFVPLSLIFSTDYWLWRMSGPSAEDIYKRHLKEILSNLSIPEKVLSADDCVEELLRARGLSESEIIETKKSVRADELDYGFLTSRALVTYMDGSKQDYYVLNKKTGDSIEGVFTISAVRPIDKIELILMDDSDGFIRLKSVSADGLAIKVPSEKRYLGKNAACLVLDNLSPDSEDLTIKAVFEAKEFYKEFE